MHTAAAIYSTSINNSPQTPVRSDWWYMRKNNQWLKMYRGHIAAHIGKFINISSLSWNCKQFSGLIGRIETPSVSLTKSWFVFEFFLLAVCLKKKKKSSITVNSPRVGSFYFILLLFLGCLASHTYEIKLIPGLQYQRLAFLLILFVRNLPLRDGTASNITSANLASEWGRGFHTLAIYPWNYTSTGCVRPSTWTLTQGG